MVLESRPSGTCVEGTGGPAPDPLEGRIWCGSRAFALSCERKRNLEAHGARRAVVEGLRLEHPGHAAKLFVAETFTMAFKDVGGVTVRGDLEHDDDVALRRRGLAKAPPVTSPELWAACVDGPINRALKLSVPIDVRARKGVRSGLSHGGLPLATAGNAGNADGACQPRRTRTRTEGDDEPRSTRGHPSLLRPTPLTRLPSRAQGVHDGPDMRHADARMTYERYARALRDEPFPCALVDIEAFDRNADLLLRIAAAGGKTLRVATKSVRCPDLLRRIGARAAELGLPRVSFMTYTARETAFLHAEGFDDFLLAYPPVSRFDADVLAKLSREGATLSVVVDDKAHLEALHAAALRGREGTRIRVVVEVDMAFRPMGASVHIGVRRSPLRTARDVLAFVDTIGQYAGLTFFGIMGYEAQIAGLGDAPPSDRAKATLIRAIRFMSRRDVEASRARLIEGLLAHRTPPTLVNGGGTGNLTWCANEPTLTEVTCGSGFLCSHLFDRYREVRPEPAAYFALEVARRPGPGLITCTGGGYVASGPPGEDRLPIPALPRGLSLLPLEGAGEVQTPLRAPGTSGLRPGDPVFFRHAKAGELAEHFPEYLFVRGDTVVGRAKTYRGFGHSFLG